MKVRFVKDSIITENGNVVVGVNNKVQFIETCLNNASYSTKVASIISYTLKNMGYELDETGYNYRKSSFFNELEKLIVHSNAYQENKPKHNYQKPTITATEKYLKDRNRKIRIAVMSYASRRPERFGSKW